MAQADDAHALEARVAKTVETKLERADVEAVLAAFTRRNGLPDMAFDEDGTVEMTIGDELDVTLALVPHFAGLLAVAALPEELAERDDITRRLLQANLSWPLTSGGTFARLPEGGAPAFCKLIGLAERDDRVFERELMAFAERAQAWLEEIGLTIDLPADAEDDEPARPAGAGGPHTRA